MTPIEMPEFGTELWGPGDIDEEHIPKSRELGAIDMESHIHKRRGTEAIFASDELVFDVPCFRGTTNSCGRFRGLGTLDSVALWVCARGNGAEVGG